MNFTRTGISGLFLRMCEKQIIFPAYMKYKEEWLREVQLYDKTGKQIINREITGEYSHVKIAGDEIIMFDGTKGCIISDTGIQRFKGDWGIEAQEVIPAAGIHRYLIAGEDELRLVYLTN